MKRAVRGNLEGVDLEGIEKILFIGNDFTGDDDLIEMSENNTVPVDIDDDEPASFKEVRNEHIEKLENALALIDQAVETLKETDEDDEECLQKIKGHAYATLKPPIVEKMISFFQKLPVHAISDSI